MFGRKQNAHVPGPVSQSTYDLRDPDYFENRALDIAYERAVCEDWATKADIYLRDWVKEAKAGFIHQGLVDFLIECSETLIAESTREFTLR